MFAAYAEKADSEEVEVVSHVNKAGGSSEWLSNSSFKFSSDSFSTADKTTRVLEKNSDLCHKSDSDSVFEISSSSPGTPPECPLKSKRSASPLTPGTPPGSPCTSGTSVSSGKAKSTLTTSQECREIVGDGHEQMRAKAQYSQKSKRSRSRGRSHRSRSSSIDSERSAKDQSSPREFSRKRQRSHSRSRRRRETKYRSRSGSQSRKQRSKFRKCDREQRRRSRSSRSRSSSSSQSLDRHSSKIKARGISDVSSDVFYEDKTRAFGNLSVTTLSRPVVAWYHSSRKGLGLSKYVFLQSRKHSLKYRYYNRILKLLEKDLTDNHGEKKVGQLQGNVSHVEEEISKVTAKFNQDLTQDPTNVNVWRKYVQFQDVVHQFERVYRRGGGATGIRVTAERKLSILDRALKENPKCEELLKERCLLAESVLPVDKLTVQLKSWIGTDAGNVVLWEALIMASQGSLSTCKVPQVKSLYQEALTNINGLKKGNSVSAKAVEIKLIDLILHLGLFLRQAGLLELMWSLISVYLEFNLAKLDPSKFHITNTVADNALTELEEAILGSQLPLSTLWLRVEALRAGTHWVPLPADADCEDPQRLVFPEDVNDLIHSINSPHLSFHLVAVTLTLLKVPILPWRQSAADAIGLHRLPWLLDGPEPVYASLLPLGTLEFKETSALLMDASQLASGPQYLIARPGQDEYIDFITQVFAASADCLPLSQKTYLLVWWLRFYRWLMLLERLGHCKLPKGRKKKMRSTAKDLLRQDSNRSNFILFKEFSLLELENGSMEGAIKVLQGTILALPTSKPVPLTQDKAAICSLYRTLVELLLSYCHLPDQSVAGSSVQSKLDLKAEDKAKALSLLVSLGKGIPMKSDRPSSTDIAAALSKYHHIAREFLDKASEEELDPFIAPSVCHVAPTFLVEWTACHGWLLFLSNSIWKAAAMVEDILSQLQASNALDAECEDSTSSIHNNFVHLQREALFEVYLSLLRHHCFETRGSYGVLRDVILRGLKEYPGNLTFSAALSDLETTYNGSGLPLWRLSKMFYDLNSAPAYVLFVFVMRYRLKQQETAARTTHALLNQGGPELPDPNTRNRMSTLLKKLTKHQVIRRCPMLWRLRLQFAAAVSSNDADCSSTFYLALEDCPWVKALYMDIVQVLPTQLAQVQDLLLEKELRLHVTPEELEILRVDS